MHYLASRDKNDTMDAMFHGSIGASEGRNEMSVAHQDTLARKRFECPVDGFQQIMSGKYKLRIIWDLQNGPRRYGEIKKGLLRGASGSGNIAPRVLSRELKSLVALGLIERTEYQVVPPKVEYSLTDVGQSLIPVIGVMHQWGVTHLLRETAGTDTPTSVAS
jgi:DNA-binding HxlR family transcriptional regulator